MGCNYGEKPGHFLEFINNFFLVIGHIPRPHSWKQQVKLGDHPGIVRFVIFDPPGRVAGRPPVQDTFSFRLTTTQIFPDIDVRLARLGADGFEDKVNVNAMSLARVIAKIGHGFAVAELGIDAFENTYLSGLISDGAADWNYWVGGYDRGRFLLASSAAEWTTHSPASNNSFLRSNRRTVVRAEGVEPSWAV